LSLGESTTVKLELRKRNTKLNPDKKHITPISDPEKLLKPKGYLKQTFVSTGKAFQPKVSQVKVKISAKEISVVDLK
jgi:hypothetical protein